MTDTVTDTCIDGQDQPKKTSRVNRYTQLVFVCDNFNRSHSMHVLIPPYALRHALKTVRATATRKARAKQQTHREASLIGGKLFVIPAYLQSVLVRFVQIRLGYIPAEAGRIAQLGTIRHA